MAWPWMWGAEATILTQRATHSRTRHFSRLDLFSATASFSRSPRTLSSPGGVEDGKAYMWLDISEGWYGGVMDEGAGERRNADEGVIKQQEG